jgi:hypothetical protein
MSYATDGRCHNAEPGTFGHECGKTAWWIGTTRGGFQAGYCNGCKVDGTEAGYCVSWHPIEPAGYVAEYRSGDEVLCFGYGDTEAYCYRTAMAQIGGAGSYFSRMKSRIKVVPVNADQASAVIEMLATPW